MGRQQAKPRGQRWEAVRRVLADCLHAPASRRRALAAEKCGDDSELRREVESLLQASSDSEGYFERLAGIADEMTGCGAQESMIDRSVSHFRVTGALGEGGMGKVYRAFDGKLQREVALKILAEDANTNPKMLARFDREATVLASLNHPNVAAIYGREEIDGRPVLVLELVDGDNLGDLLANGALDLDQLLYVARGIARGLEAAHEKGVIHRDLKPSNVMLTSRGDVKVLDFGIAKSLPFASVEEEASDLTAAGVVLGTVPYMSPEQVRGLDLDPRADVWSLGCLLFEMLTGDRVFERETVADTLAAVIEYEPRLDQLPGDTPQALGTLIGKALEKQLDARLGSMGEIRGVIESIIAERASGEFSVTLDGGGVVDRARAHFSRGAWQDAFDLLAPLMDRLEADDLARLGEAAWWIGELERSVEADQLAFSAYLSEGDKEAKAAAMALRMADHNGRKLQPALVSGWLRRAERLLDGHPVSRTQGWLLRALIQQANGEGRHADAAADADRMLEIANQLGDRDLQAMAIHYQGTARVHAGDIREGMDLIDEAAVAAISGELSPMATAIIYCNAISACRSMADYRRAGEWTAAAKQWCERQSISGFPGVCRVVRAEVMRLHGNWADAEEEARRACTELETFAPSVVRVAFHELGEIRLRVGDFEGADEAFRNARQLGRDPQPGASLLKLAEGDSDGAAAAIRRALENAGSDRLARARLLPAQVEIAIERGDLETGRVACAEMNEIAESFEAPVVQGAREHAFGALRLAEGNTEAAAAHLRTAIALWGEANMPYEGARARELQARAYEVSGDNVSAVLELQAACEAFVRLGAVPDSRRAAETLADHWV